MPRGSKKSQQKAENSSVEIVYLNPHDLIPYVNNTKNHSEEQINLLASSMIEFNFDVPIVVDSDMVIIKGHARREASIKANFDSVPVIIRDDLTPSQVKAARIADNKLAESDWNYDMLRLELESLKELNVDLSLTGFDESILNALMDSIDNFSFDSGEMPDTGEDMSPDDDDENEDPDDMMDVEGSKDGRMFVLMISFDTKEKAEELCRCLQLEDPDFVPNSTSKTILGSNIDIATVFYGEE